MPIDQILEIVKDKPDLIQEIKDLADKAGALEKVKLANSDLTTSRTALEEERKALKAQIAKLSETKGTDSNPELLALKEDFAKLQAEIKTANEKAEKATKEKLATDLRNDIVTVAANKAINAGQVYALMQVEGLVGYDAESKPFFYRVNDKGDVVKAKSPSEAVDAFLKSNPHLEKSSGTNGSGGQPNKTGATGKFNPMDHL
jgi:seryl-tRNA synthetase